MAQPRAPCTCLPLPPGDALLPALPALWETTAVPSPAPHLSCLCLGVIPKFSGASHCTLHGCLPCPPDSFSLVCCFVLSKACQHLRIISLSEPSQACLPPSLLLSLPSSLSSFFLLSLPSSLHLYLLSSPPPSFSLGMSLFLSARLSLPEPFLFTAQRSRP